MPAPWAVDEVKTADLKDKRLNARLGQVLSQLAARPTASIPAACGGRAEMVAAYRFCENEHTSFDTLLQSHGDATRERIAAQPVALLVQDTTEIDVTRPEQQVADSEADIDEVLVEGMHEAPKVDWGEFCRTPARRACPASRTLRPWPWLPVVSQGSARGQPGVSRWRRSATGGLYAGRVRWCSGRRAWPRALAPSRSSASCRRAARRRTAAPTSALEAPPR
jgi:hypothetical protein